jgi:hypothetical protein
VRVGGTEPEIGVGIGEPYQASAAAVADFGDEIDRLGGVGDGAGVHRRGWRSVPAEAGRLRLAPSTNAARIAASEK